MNPQKSTDNKNEPFAGPNFYKSPKISELPKPEFDKEEKKKEDKTL